MSRVRFFRQRVQTEASSVMAKALSEYLASEIRALREVSPEETALIASDCMEYLQRYLGQRKLEVCSTLGITHERIPVKTPNMIAHIEAFHSILEDECYTRHVFGSFAEA